MTMPDNETIPQRLHRRLAEAKARGASEEEIQQELRWAQDAINARTAADPERKRSLGDQAGSAAQTFADAATGGIAGLVTDTVAPGEFKENRRIRAEGKAALNPSLRTALEVGGALAMPIPGGAVVRAAEGAGKLARVGMAMTDAAIQAGTTGAVSNFDEASIPGVKRAIGKGVQSAVLGGAIAAPLAGASGLAARGLGRLRKMQGLEDAAWSIRDAMTKIDNINYSIARGEAQSTQPIRDVLSSKTVKPFADVIRNSEKFAGADDATVLMETYKLMSQAQRKADAAIEGSTEHQARQIVIKDDIGLAKERMLRATETPSTAVIPGRAIVAPAPRTAGGGFGGEVHPSVRDALDAHRVRLGLSVSRKEGTPMQQTAREALDRHITESVVAPPLSGSPNPLRVLLRDSQEIPIDAGIPSLRTAVNAHRTKAGEFDRFTEGARIGKSVGSGKSLPEQKIVTEGRVAFMREIPKMTTAEAEAALAGVLGRTGEAARITNSPLGLFGLMSSAVRLPMQMYRTGPIIQALEERIGRNYGDHSLSDIVRSTASRVIGQENTP